MLSQPAQKRREAAQNSLSSDMLRGSSHDPVHDSSAHTLERSLSETRALQGVIERVLTERIAKNDVRRELDCLVSSFHGFKPPAISTVDYVRRIFSYSHCSPACFSTAMYYIDHLGQQRSRSEFCVTTLNVHRVFLVAILLAIKYMEDVSFSNEHFARVGGVSLTELNRLELSMLKALDFRLYVSAEDLRTYEATLVRECVEYLDADDLKAQTPRSPLRKPVITYCTDIYLSGDISQATSAASTSTALSRVSSCDPLWIALGDAGLIARDSVRSGLLSPVSLASAARAN
eukprot:CAMPEP_0185833204 /NCGR_PEP_ID=MMETSP1353-20130828/2535_1 /TAXON_ID=1077150 /ORGANISM="Erythrolobus australicus, Strain CCMP3124" /LENGTH=288 /DNA_ID=CAMNT_0028531459 /DNA_START=641 /DNA_END=1507 /DNA_ORIENTATION=+